MQVYALFGLVLNETGETLHYFSFHLLITVIMSNHIQYIRVKANTLTLTVLFFSVNDNGFHCLFYSKALWKQ